MLTELDYEVVEVSSAEEALDLLANGRQFDVVITDHLMPGMSGAALAYEVRSRWPLIRTVIMSGYALAEGIGPGSADAVQAVPAKRVGRDPRRGGEGRVGLTVVQEDGFQARNGPPPT